LGKGQVLIYQHQGQVFRQSDGPAIWGGCVPAFWDKKRDGALFAVMVQILLSITHVAVQG
jgi:hypothetical protein